MSDVKRYNAKLASFDGQYRIVVLAKDYDALAQRCRELEAVLDQRNAECDRLTGEVEALRKDATRIDWLAAQARMSWGHKEQAGWQLDDLPELVLSSREECRPDDLRRAIDEAMEAAHDES